MARLWIGPSTVSPTVVWLIYAMTVVEVFSPTACVAWVTASGILYSSSWCALPFSHDGCVFLVHSVPWRCVVSEPRKTAHKQKNTDPQIRTSLLSAVTTNTPRILINTASVGRWFYQSPLLSTL